MNALTQPQRFLQAASGLEPDVQISTPDYVSQYTQLPAHWEYSIDPATGISRADYFGELFLNGGSIVGGATSGSGPFVLQNGATLTAPVINGGAINAGTINGGTLSGTVTNAGTISGGVLAAPNIVGVTNGSNAPAGDVGEFLNVVGTVTSLTSSTWTAITGAVLTLTPGDWDVWGLFTITPSANNASALYGSLSQTPTVQGTVSVVTINGAGAGFTGFGQTQLALPVWRLNVTTATTVYLNSNVVYGSGTCTANGQIYARRVR